MPPLAHDFLFATGVAAGIRTQGGGTPLPLQTPKWLYRTFLATRAPQAGINATHSTQLHPLRFGVAPPSLRGFRSTFWLPPPPKAFLFLRSLPKFFLFSSSSHCSLSLWCFLMWHSSSW